ncbi:MAG: zinc-ribbon domain-containing protein [Chloroflexi bacterium]|nr:zinc-ribbon domain-containing protein [Chloroflexota bacterium]
MEGGVPRFCTSCGASLEDGDRLCVSCGAVVAQVQPAPPAAPPPAPVPVARTPRRRRPAVGRGPRTPRGDRGVHAARVSGGGRGVRRPRRGSLRGRLRLQRVVPPRPRGGCGHPSAHGQLRLRVRGVRPGPRLPRHRPAEPAGPRAHSAVPEELGAPAAG